MCGMTVLRKPNFRQGNLVERVLPDALDLSKQSDPVVLRFNHSRDWTLDSTENTLTLTVDSKGLKYSSVIDDDPQFSILRSKIRKGLIKGSSFAAMASHRWEEQGKDAIGFVTIHKLIDVAAVDTPAYGCASVSIRQEGQSLEEDYNNWKATKERLARADNIQ